MTLRNGVEYFPGLRVGQSTIFSRMNRFKVDLTSLVGTINAGAITDVSVVNTFMDPGDLVWSVMFTEAPTAGLGIGGWWTDPLTGNWTLRVFNATAGNVTAAAFAIQYLTLATGSPNGYVTSPAIKIGLLGTPLASITLQSGSINLVAGSALAANTIRVVNATLPVPPNLTDMLLGCFVSGAAGQGLPAAVCLTNATPDFGNVVPSGKASMTLLNPTGSASAAPTIARTMYFLTASPVSYVAGVA